MKTTTEVKIKDVAMYRDGGTQEITYENGLKFYTPSGAIGLQKGVYAKYPKSGDTPVSIELQIEILFDLVNYYKTLLYEANQKNG